MTRVLPLLLFVAMLLLSLGAAAALPPGEYDRMRQAAPVAIGGVVEHDVGGQARVRVEHVTRGQVMRGQIVTVVYPLDSGPQPPGAAVYYRRFAAGTRIMVWGQGLPMVQIVHGGIDVISQPRPVAKKGGCAGCTMGRPQSGGTWAMVALVLMLLWRRRR